ncbi:PepSY-associated TM helix domain-containing protein [Paraburkholderia sp.]|uniref:PepSY-associated TM helix domain-containing protein n=1 Tax=Paraburkholderia sp. TaxID=1926495 RepID=UPI00238414BA|nr:PepSY-associated TM helix domain-containing protein [Paraburkholderia sp.]MDE1182594.1 PepSY-associated TM helix domain-containing protein [Paraburkholderia sp.]
MQLLRYIHRWVALIVAIVTLYLGVTGSAIQMIDIRSILAHIPATDANVRAMHEGFDGPPGFAVRKSADYAAQSLPVGAPLASMLDQTVRSARASLGATPLRYVELRMAGDTPVGQVGVDDGYLRVNALSGALVARLAQEPKEAEFPDSARNTFKKLHRMTTFGDWALLVNCAAALALAMLIVTGTIVYLRMFFQRRKNGGNKFFWSGGGLWRSLHRTISIVCSLLLVWITLTGGWLTADALYRSISIRQSAGVPSPAVQPVPLDDARLPQMLSVTLAAVRAAAGDAPIQVVRLRNYGGYRQGVVVTGGDASRQFVFNADTGVAMSETEPGYPRAHFPFGWQAHQLAKSLHRGDFIGLPGRLLDVLAALALIYLSISGAVMYWQMWQRRRQNGRNQILWK